MIEPQPGFDLGRNLDRVSQIGRRRIGNRQDALDPRALLPPPRFASLEVVLTGLDPGSADTTSIPALAAAFVGFEFSMASLKLVAFRGAAN